MCMSPLPTTLKHSRPNNPLIQQNRRKSPSWMMTMMMILRLEQLLCERKRNYEKTVRLKKLSNELPKLMVNAPYIPSSMHRLTAKQRRKTKHRNLNLRSLDGLAAGSEARRRAMIFIAPLMHPSKPNWASKTLSTMIRSRRGGSTKKILMQLQRSKLRNLHLKAHPRDRSVQRAGCLHHYLPPLQYLHFLRR